MKKLRFNSKIRLSFWQMTLKDQDPASVKCFLTTLERVCES